MKFFNTKSNQIELLPRITVYYNYERCDEEVLENGVAIQWLWFGIFFII
jgi:hypothetical protein